MYILMSIILKINILESQNFQVFFFATDPSGLGPPHTWGI
jgi:hypothetical protein